MNKLDQQINEAANNEIYNHIDFIVQDWKDAYYDVEHLVADHVLESKTAVSRKSKADKLKEDYQALKDYFEKREGGEITFYFGHTPEQEIKCSNPTAYKAYKLLNEGLMIDLKYNVKKVETAIILKENTMAEVKLRKLLNQQFKPGDKLTNADIKAKLQRIYNQLNLRAENGKIKVATASQLEGNKWFDVETCKVKNNHGNYENGLMIIRAHFNLLMAA